MWGFRGLGFRRRAWENSHTREKKRNIRTALHKPPLLESRMLQVAESAAGHRTLVEGGWARLGGN